MLTRHGPDRVFRALADPTRRAILARLRRGPVPVNTLAQAFPVTRPAISRHLRVLREAALVRDRPDGRQRYCELNPAALRDVDAWLAPYRAMWQHNLARLKAHVERP